MITANELRIDVANKQRMQKTKDKWLGFADRLHDIEMWQEKTEYKGVKIGDKVEFIESRPCNGGFNLSKKHGVAFAFSDDFMLVIYRSELKRVKIKK